MTYPIRAILSTDEMLCSEKEKKRAVGVNKAEGLGSDWTLALALSLTGQAWRAVKIGFLEVG